MARVETESINGAAAVLDGYTLLQVDQEERDCWAKAFLTLGGRVVKTVRGTNSILAIKGPLEHEDDRLGVRTAMWVTANVKNRGLSNTKFLRLLIDARIATEGAK